MDRVENAARPARPMNRKRKKVCIFCEDKVEFIDYKVQQYSPHPDTAQDSTP